MKKNSGDLVWRSLLFKSVVVSGVFIFQCDRAFSQVTPDNTLGDESSVVNTRDETSDSIDGGAVRGQNLFHSFEEFNVGEDRGVYFANPDDVNNIFSRVTGNDVSNILGTLGVDGAANLFLINPNGIVFGEGASLDVQGSFAATTADGIEFGEQGFFGVSNPESPKLLTINPSAYLFNQVAPGAIINNSRVPAGQDLSGIDVFGLRVPNGKGLMLVGGNVSMDGGWAIANGGRIELGGLTAPGSIGIKSNGNNFSLSFPDGVQRGDISLNNKAIVSVIGEGGGSIAANARNIEILGNSEFSAGIELGLGTANAQAGDITINSRNLIVRDSQLSTIVYGEGNAGDFKIIASDSVELSGEIPDKEQGNAEGILATNPGGILATIDITGKGKSGNIYLETRNLSVSDGSKVQVATFGEGDAGNLFIRADEIDVFETEKPNYYSTGIFASVGRDPRTVNPPKGDGGDLTIETGKLSIRDGGAIDVSTQGEGNGGQLFIKASDAIEVTGDSPYNSNISAEVTDRGVGDGGSITIETPKLSVQNGGEIISSTLGRGDSGDISITAENSISLDASSYIVNNVQSSDAVGDAGKIDITTGSLSATNGSQINSFTRGQGNAGDITIQATDRVSFNGFDSDNYSSAFSSVEAGANGNGGNINITARSLSLTNGGQLEASVFGETDNLPGGEGQGGNINIDVDDTLTIADGNAPGISATLGAGAVGSGGDIDIQAENLVVKNDGLISASTFGIGKAGNLTINAENFTVHNSQVSSSTFGKGDAGNLTVNASESVELSGEDPDGFPGGLLAQVDIEGQGKGGNLTIDTKRLSVSDGSKIQVSTFGLGNSGNLTISATDIEVFETQINNFFSTGIFAETSLARIPDSPDIQSIGKGNAGNLTIETEGLRIKDGGQVSASTFGLGNAGTLTVKASDSIEVSGIEDVNAFESFRSESFLAAEVKEGATGNGGNVTIDARQLIVKDGGRISASTYGRGDAGDLTIKAFDSIQLSGSESGLFAEVAPGSKGTAGDINVQANSLFSSDNAQIRASSSENGNAGSININASDFINLIDSNITTFADRTSGGAINITAGDINLRGNSDIQSNIFSGAGGGGNINITADSIIAFDDSDIFAFAADGKGGNINLDTPAYFGENFTLNSLTSNPKTLNNNFRADVNATGRVSSGAVDIPNISSIQNSLNTLPNNSLNTDELVANSCVVPAGDRQEGKFIITGIESLPVSPGGGRASHYSTGEVRNVPEKQSNWQAGDPIVEPQGAYRLANGKLVLSRECSR
jgi:filamentous hemagglutinin family protein